MIKHKRYDRLKKELGEMGLMVKGTITERYLKDGKLGPYYQWTFKVGYKTRTINLSEEQVPVYSKAIKNYQRVREILKEMQKLSMEILEETTVGVKKRKPRQP